VKHYVMTRSSYGPEWSRAANERRLMLTRAVTAALLKAQRGTPDWTWIVLLDSRDPLLEARMRVFREAAPHFEPITWEPTDVRAAEWDKHGSTATLPQRVAATAYRHPGWLELTPRDQAVLQTRLDDDDGLTTDHFKRLLAATRGLAERTALMFPTGVRVWDGRQSFVRHDTNAMHSLWTPPGDETTIYSYGHRLVGRGQPVKVVDDEPAWLWVRHAHTISGWKKADFKITDGTRRMFPIDWAAIK